MTATAIRSEGVAFARPQQALWTAAALLACIIGFGTPVPNWALAVVAVCGLSVVHGLMAFYRCGGSRLSSAGIFCFTTAILLGLGAYPALVSGEATPHLAMAAIAAFTVQVWCTPVRPTALSTEYTPGGLTVARPDRLLEATAIAVFVVALALRTVLGRGNTPGELLALGGIVLVAIVRATSGTDAISRTALPGVLTLIYAAAIHSGDGRLRLVSAAFVVMFLGSLLDQGKKLKLMAMAGLPAGLFVMAWLRLRHVDSIRDGLSDGRNGLESGIVPLGIFADLLESQAVGAQPLRWGATYLSVPSRFSGFTLPGLQQNAIGYELVGISDPERYGSGFSVAGLAVAEWTYNFGLLAVPLFGLFLAAVFARLDDAMQHAWTNLRTRGRATDVFALAALVTLWSGIPDFAWGGSHVLLTRVILRTVPLLAIALLFTLAQRPQPASTRPSHRINVRPTLPRSTATSPAELVSTPTRSSERIRQSESTEPDDVESATRGSRDTQLREDRGRTPSSLFDEPRPSHS